MKMVSSILKTKASKELDEQAKREAKEVEDKSIASVLEKKKEDEKDKE